MITCLHCKKQFQENRKEQKFCSHACHSLSRKGITVLNSGQFPKGIHPKSQFKKGHTAPKHKDNCLCFRCDAKIGKKHPGWKGGIRSNPDLYSHYMVVAVNKRRALKMKNGGFHTVVEWQSLKQKYSFMCLCCKQQEPFIKLTEDHIVPLSRGGTNDISNIQPLCKSCNAIKQTKIVDYRNAFNKKINI